MILGIIFVLSYTTSPRCEMQPRVDSFPTGTKKERVPNPLLIHVKKTNIPMIQVWKDNHSFHSFIISHFSCATTTHVTVKLVAQFILIPIRLWIIMSITKNKGCGVALLNKHRHSPCPKIISAIFCNNSCQVLLWQLNHWHTPSWLLIP